MRRVLKIYLEANSGDRLADKLLLDTVIGQRLLGLEWRGMTDGALMPQIRRHVQAQIVWEPHSKKAKPALPPVPEGALDPAALLDFDHLAQIIAGSGWDNEAYVRQNVLRPLCWSGRYGWEDGGLAVGSFLESYDHQPHRRVPGFSLRGKTVLDQLYRYLRKRVELWQP